ncbi:hypothetical protein S245_066665, partial [Arachis hypogaea]
GDTIQCTVKDIFVPIFEGLLAEDNVYVVTNFGVALNTIKFKSTRHEFRIHFKRDTIVRPGLWVFPTQTTIRNCLSMLSFQLPRIFFARVNKLDHVDGQSIMPLVRDQPISVEKDFLRLSVYKTIIEIKEHNQ